MIEQEPQPNIGKLSNSENRDKRQYVSRKLGGLFLSS
jgi:hypothetical protein